MGATDFEFTAEEFQGCRLIRVAFPSAISPLTVSVAVSRYLALWDVDLPIVAINDVRRLAALTPRDGPIILAILKRNVTEPRFLGSVWLTGGNPVLEGQLHALLLEAGRDPDCVVTTEQRALDYLRERIALGRP